ncbi:MAG TPA: MFS transporter [Candidatus Acidoferrales bacterium]|nr:MFS transporter [Candidatus Acidoferrales bacterium]
MNESLNTAQQAKRAAAFYGWKLVPALFLLDFLNMGFPLYGGTVINTYMLKEIAMSRASFGLGFTMLNLFVGLPAMLVAAAILRWGIRKTFAIGSAVILAGAMWLALVASRPWHYVLGFGVIIGTGISFGTIVPVSTAITRWFKRYRGRAMAIALSASGFAGFVGAPVTNKILAANGGNWRQAWEVVAGVAILSAAVALVFVKESPEALGQEPDGGAAASPIVSADARVTKYPWTPREAYRTLGYWMVVIGGVASQFPFFFFTAHWILHLRGAGFRAADAASAMALFSIGAVAGRLIGGWLMDKLAARFAFMLGLCCYFAGSLLAIDAHPAALWGAFLAAILYGLGFGWTFVCLNTATAHFFGPAAFPKLNGMAMLLTAILCSPAGFIGGKLFDVYGSYTRAFTLNMLIAGIGIAALAFARMPAPPGARLSVAIGERGK